MKPTAYFGIKYHADNRNKNEIDAITAVLHANGIETICIARDIEKWGAVTLDAARLMQITFAKIDASDFVVLEMSEKGVGLGIEAGYACANGKPLIVLIKAGRELSTTLSGIADVVIKYHRPEEIDISDITAAVNGRKNA